MKIDSTYTPDIDGGVKRIGKVALPLLVALSVFQGYLWWSEGVWFAVVVGVATVVTAIVVARIAAPFIGRGMLPFMLAPEWTALVYIAISVLIGFASVFAFAAYLR